MATEKQTLSDDVRVTHVDEVKFRKLLKKTLKDGLRIGFVAAILLIVGFSFGYNFALILR